MRLLKYLLFLSLIAPAYAENWVEVVRNNQIILSYDETSIQINPNYLSVLTKAQKSDDYQSDACLYGSDYACNTKHSSTKKIKIYGFNCQGEYALKTNQGLVWVDIPDGLIYWDLEKAICQRFGHLLKITPYQMI